MSMITTEHQNISIEKVKSSRLKDLNPADLRFGRDYTDHMFIADYRNGMWGDFRIMPFGEIPLSPATCALHYGQAIFEGMKAYKGDDGKVRLFRPEQNARRFNMSAKRMCMPEIPEELFMMALRELVHLDSAWVPAIDGCSLYLRPFMFADEVFLGVKPGSDYKFMIICSPASSYYAEPIKVRVERKFSRAVEGGVGFAKAAGNYAAALYPTLLATKEGYHQLIWTDSREHKYIEEAGTMNLMFQIGDSLVTPSLERETILAGITRNSIIQIARDQGINLEERRISVDEILEAHNHGELKDAFGLGTAANMAPIRTIGIDGHDIELPPLSERKISAKLGGILSDIKYGRVDDPYGWVEEV